MVSLVLAAVLGIPLTLLHEIGHAVAARKALGTGVEVNVGSTGKLAEFKLGQVRFQINAVSTSADRGGHGAFDVSRARACDIIVISLAGPAASLAGAVATALLWRATSQGSAPHDVLWVATVVGAMGVIMTLIPLEITERSGERWRTDGRLALDAYQRSRSLS